MFDDSPASNDASGGGRIELSTTQASTRLQLGKLLHQRDNQRLNPRGHGVDLTTQAYGALRAGSGVLISAWHDAHSKQIDARPAQAVLDSAAQLTQTLAQSAQDHEAMLQGEPIVKGAKPGEKSKQLPVQIAQFEQHESLAATDTRGDPGDGTDATISGGAGTVPAWSRPELLIAAPAGIGAYTPAHQLWSAGTHIVAQRRPGHPATRAAPPRTRGQGRHRSLHLRPRGQSEQAESRRSASSCMRPAAT